MSKHPIHDESGLLIGAAADDFSAPTGTTMNDLHTIGLNPFAVTLLAESMLKSEYVKRSGTKPLTFEFPVRRSDCAGWAGVRITIEAVPVSDTGSAGT